MHTHPNYQTYNLSAKSKNLFALILLLESNTRSLSKRLMLLQRNRDWFLIQGKRELNSIALLEKKPPSIPYSEIWNDPLSLGRGFYFFIVLCRTNPMIMPTQKVSPELIIIVGDNSITQIAYSTELILSS